MIVDTNQTELVWSDGAVLELGTNFPAPLDQLISNPTSYLDIRTSLRKIDAQRPTEYREAEVQPDTHHDRYLKISSMDGNVSTSVEALYVEYLLQRYPGGSFWIKGKFDPIAFVVAGQLRAAVMPIKF